jgi:hypothetical protein
LEAIVHTADKLPMSPMSALSSNRRQWMTGAVAAIGGLAVGSSHAWAGAEDGVSRTAEAIHQEPVFKATPGRIDDTLTDAQQFQKVELLGRAMKSSDLAANAAQISREPGWIMRHFWCVHRR